MISSQEESLLLFRKWMNASSDVKLAFSCCGEGVPLSTILIIRLNVRVTAIDEEAMFVAFSTGEDGLISLGFKDATFDFQTLLEVPSEMAANLSGSIAEIDELLATTLSTGLRITLFTLKT
jgi:hypothetical protein